MIQILFVGEAWGAEEAKRRSPFAGSSGKFLVRNLKMVGIEHGAYVNEPSGESWIDWTSCRTVAVTNCFNLQPRPTNAIDNLCGPAKEGVPGMPYLQKGKYIRREYGGEIDRLYSEVRQYDPNLIIALGGTALTVLTKNPLPISKNRGTLSQSAILRPSGEPYKILPTYHPASCLYDHSHRPIFRADLEKAKRHALTPEFSRPERQLWIEPTLADLARFEAQAMAPDWSRPCGVDIETKGGTITEIGFGYPNIGLVVPFYSRERRNYWKTAEEEIAAWTWVHLVLQRLKVPIFQNGLYDLNYLWRTMGITVPYAGEDTMLLHHSLQPEMPKSLQFLGSIYTDEPAWKLMRQQETLKKED